MVYIVLNDSKVSGLFDVAGCVRPGGAAAVERVGYDGVGDDRMFL